MRRALLLLVLMSAPSRADWSLVEESVYVYVRNDARGDPVCSIDLHLWVSGPKREHCVRRLEQAAHLARFEMVVAGKR